MTILSPVWKLLLEYPILSSTQVCLLLTTLQSVLMCSFFTLVDWGYIRMNRLKVKREVKNRDYGEALRMGILNAILLFTCVSTVSYIESGDIHGGYKLQGIKRELLPVEAPTLWEYSYQTIFAIICVDLVMYWMHRLLHSGFLYRYIHSVHHKHPDPISLHGLYVHIAEMFIVLMVITMTTRLLYELVGIHPLVVYSVPFILTGHNIIEHSGYDDGVEYLPFGIFGCSAMHMVHHQLPGTNFGFYTYIWDTIFGTKYLYSKLT